MTTHKVIRQTKAGAERFVKESVKGSRKFDRVIAAPSPLPQPNATSQLLQTPRLATLTAAQRGSIGWGEIPTFALPQGKELVFMAAGRNQAKALGKDVFDWGFTMLDETRMAPGTEYHPGALAPQGFTSPVPQSRRHKSISGSFFANDNAKIWWANNYTQWADVYFRNAPNANFGDMEAWLNSQVLGWADPYREGQTPYRMVSVDVENIGNGNEAFAQETANLWVYMLSKIRANIHASTKLTTLEPVAFNAFAFANAQANHEEYYTPAQHPNVWLWEAAAQATTASNNRNMPANIIGQRVRDFVDYNMAGNYLYDAELLPNGNYEGTNGQPITINHKTGVNWLTNVLGNQEINMARSGKPRMAYHWLFNNDGNVQIKKNYNGALVANPYPDIPLSATQAEGLAVFHFFTGATGAILWDNAYDLTPGDATPQTSPSYTGQGNQRVYATKHYLHGLWRLFGNHGHLFDGNEQYLNADTELSFDGGNNWVKWNAVQLRNQKGGLCARAIVNIAKRRILVAAQHPYGKAGQQYSLMVRYNANGINWQDSITLNADEVFLGEGILPPSV